MTQLHDLQFVALSLQCSSGLLQGCQRRAVGRAQVVAVGVLVDGAIGAPTAGVPPAFGVTQGMEAALLSDEAERDEGSQPVKPLRRVGRKRQQAPYSIRAVTRARACTSVGSRPRSGRTVASATFASLVCATTAGSGADPSRCCTSASSTPSRCRSRATSSTRAVTCSWTVIRERCR
jgi:hypothetical protein